MPRRKSVSESYREQLDKDVDKWERMAATKRSDRLRWEHADAGDLLACVAAVTEDGAALLLSKTSDGGALVLQVLNGGPPLKRYPANMAELTEYLSEITEIASS